MPRSAKTSSEITKKPATKKRGKATSKKTTKIAKAKKSSHKKAVPVDHQPLPVMPEVFTLTPSLAHGHTTYQLTSEFAPSRKPRRNLTIVLCVSIIMTLIVGAWILSLKKFINFDAQAAANSQSQTDFANLKEELDSTMEEVKSQLQNLDDLKAATTTPTATATPAHDEAMRDAFKNLAEQRMVTPTVSPATTSVEPSVLPN